MFQTRSNPNASKMVPAVTNKHLDIFLINALILTCLGDGFNEFLSQQTCSVASVCHYVGLVELGHTQTIAAWDEFEKIF